MQVRDADLLAQLQNQMPPLIWISGDESLLVSEMCQLVIKAAKKHGMVEKTVVFLESSAKWDVLLDAAASRSLLDDKKIIDIRLESLKLGKDASKMFGQFLSILSDDDFVLLRSAKLDAASKKLKWVKQLDRAGMHCAIWPVDFQQLPQWISKRSSSMRLSLSVDAAEALAAKVEGNLLAAKQELDKLQLQNLSEISAETIYEQVGDFSRFDVFKLTDQMLDGNGDKAIKIFRTLLAEGMALPVIIWALAKDLRDLAAIEASGGQMTGYQPIEYTPPVIWKKRAKLFLKAILRKRRYRYSAMLQYLLEIEKASKGMGSDAEYKAEKLLLLVANGQSIY